MKGFFLKHKKAVSGVVLFWGILLILFFINLGFSLTRTNNYIHGIRVKTDSLDYWANAEIRDLDKEKWWLEQQLMLTKSDSFSMGINLKDSVVQVQLEGTVLFQAKILHQKPTQFYSKFNRETYLNVFGKIEKIDSEVANVPKRAIIKVQAPPIGTEREASTTDSLVVDVLHWKFITSNNIQFVINGVQPNADSTFSIPATKDVFIYRVEQSLHQPFQKEYTATIFLWLNDNDAKAIYRALPEQAKFIFRN